MTAQQNGEVKPIPVQIVKEARQPTTIVGAPRTFNLTSAPIDILPESRRRVRAVVSVVGTGVVAFGNNSGTMASAVATSMGIGALVQGPANFELQSTNVWYAMLVSGANTTVSVIPETEVDL